MGPGYLVHIAYAYLLVTVGIGVLLRLFVRSPRPYRTQTGALLVGALVPFSANVAFTLGYSPVPALDLTTFAFTATGVFFALALFRFDLLDLIPVARASVIDEFGDGLVVLDGDGRIADFNENAARVLDASVDVGRPAVAVLPGGSLADADGRVIEDGPDGSTRAYQLRVEPLRDLHGQVAGRAVALRDITGRKEYEQRLEVANRLLRHNLRTDVGIILGRADLLETAVRDELETHARSIRKTAERLADLSEKAALMEDTLEAEALGPVPVEAIEAVEGAVADLRDRWPDASIRVTRPETAWVRAADTDLLGVAVSNLVENAIEHADSPEPDVRVSIEKGSSEAADDATRIRVADDGPGIPAMEYRVLSAGNETPLDHGSGLGLWLVYWIVSASGGEVTFSENEPRGTVVTLHLEPVAPPDRA